MTPKCVYLGAHNYYQRPQVMSTNCQPNRPHASTTTTAMTNLPPPPKAIRIEPASDPKNLASLKRLNSLLLPINYRENFYKDILSNPTDAMLSRVAFWEGGIGVVGGIRARWDPPASKEASTGTDKRGGSIYLMTICVLSPFRRLGIANALLGHIIETARSWGVEELYAHVWEDNHEALEWYRRMGFSVDEGVVENYYRRLRPAGAKVVRLRLGP